MIYILLVFIIKYYLNLVKDDAILWYNTWVEIYHLDLFFNRVIINKATTT